MRRFTIASPILRETDPMLFGVEKSTVDNSNSSHPGYIHGIPLPHGQLIISNLHFRTAETDMSIQRITQPFKNHPTVDLGIRMCLEKESFIDIRRPLDGVAIPELEMRQVFVGVGAVKDGVCG